MTTPLFLLVLFSYIGAEAWFASRSTLPASAPLASLWAWRIVLVTLVSTDWYFGWPFFLV